MYENKAIENYQICYEYSKFSDNVQSKINLYNTFYILEYILIAHTILHLDFKMS